MTKTGVPKRQRTGVAFTLIELIVVVSIILILAAIGVVNMGRAQIKAKVSRSSADMRSMAVALESYFVDYQRYTRDSDSSFDTIDVGEEQAENAVDPYNSIYHFLANGALQLTTPIAYISSLPKDPFAGPILLDGKGAETYRIGSGSWSYPCLPYMPWCTPANLSTDHQWSHGVDLCIRPFRSHSYILIGIGPDRARSRNNYKNFPFTGRQESESPSMGLGKFGQPLSYVTYDPTNGSLSKGDVHRFGGQWNGGRFMLDGRTVGRADPYYEPDNICHLWMW